MPEQVSPQEAFIKVREALAARNTTLRIEKGALLTKKARQEDLEDQITRTEEAITLARYCVRERAKVKDDIEQLVTSMIQSIFGPEFRFELEETFKDDLPYGYKPLIWEDDNPDDPSDQGGGIRNITGLGIRLVFLLLLAQTPENPDGLAPILLLDEPNVNLDSDKWPKWVEFMQSLQKDVDLQLVAITHSGTEFPDTFVVRKPGNVSLVERL